MQNISTLKRWSVPLIAALFFYYEFIQMNMMNSLNDSLSQTFHVGAEMLGGLSSYYFIANLIFLFPAGIILDRFSTRRVVLIALAICIIGTFLFSQSTDLGWAKVFRFATGIGSAFCFLSCIRLATRWLPSKQLALASGIIVTLAMLGGWTAQGPLTLLINAIGWRHAIVADAGLGVIIFIAIALWVRDRPDHVEEVHQQELSELHTLGFWHSLQRSYLNLQNWLCGIYTNMMNLPVFIVGAIFGIPYLTQAHGMSVNSAAFISGMIFFGTVIGSPLAGFFSDALKQRRLPMQIGTLLSFVIFAAILYLPNIGVLGFAALFFLIGLTTSTQIISYPLVAETNPKLLTATCVSVVSFNVISGGAIFQPLVGKLLDAGWQGKILNGHHVYSAHDYKSAFSILMIAFVVALVATFFMKESRCQAVD
tara:strand:- start:59336 stop:60604 length:1269 start_codon:yes stop_codon:yes gene_type:complete